jgi:DNA-binding NtrC family response regulator
MEPNVGSTHLELDPNSELRLLALAPLQMQGQIRRQLAPLGVTIDFVSKATDVSHLVLHRAPYQVALLPAALPDNGWWSLWGEIAVLNPRPEILVYAQSASFRLWSGVLEMGGYDVIVEPFTDDELQQAVTRAAQSFTERLAHEPGNE